MDLIVAAPEDFLLVLPDQRTADNVFNNGQPWHGPSFSLLFKRWTRLAHADSAVLPDLVNVELRGVPAHAWDIATAQQ